MNKKLKYCNISKASKRGIKIELGKQYLAEHANDIKIFIDGNNVPFLGIKSNRPGVDYFEPDLSDFYTQVGDYFMDAQE